MLELTSGSMRPIAAGQDGLLTAECSRRRNQTPCGAPCDHPTSITIKWGYDSDHTKAAVVTVSSARQRPPVTQD